MLSWRSGGAVVLAATVASAVLYWTVLPRPAVHAGAPGRWGDGELGLVGTLHAPGIEPTRCEVRCSSMRLESTPIAHRADIDAEGRFELDGLSDVDYRIDVVVRSNPALVVASVEYVRPGGDELVIEADPTRLFGPDASTDPER